MASGRNRASNIDRGASVPITIVSERRRPASVPSKQHLNTDRIKGACCHICPAKRAHSSLVGL